MQRKLICYTMYFLFIKLCTYDVLPIYYVVLCKYIPTAYLYTYG